MNLTMSRRLDLIFRNILHARGPLSRVHSKKPQTLWNIPSEIVEIILQLLSDLDQACFALSCKRLYVYYISSSGHRGICQLSTLPRTELLPRLQDKRWIYCGGCRNLHRYSMGWPLCVQTSPFIAFRNILQARRPRSAVESKKVELDKPKTLWEIPSNITDTIFQLLSDLDQACLALSCKRLHACYVSYINQCGILPHSILPRTELLHRLQNDRWGYCRVCKDLHRYSEWRPLLFVRKCEPKPSIPQCKTWCYTENAGSVDICPCSSITFHQKQHPDEFFKSHKQALFKSSDRFVHFCVRHHPLARVHVKTEMRFDNRTKTFQVENEFIFRTYQEDTSLERFRNINFRLSRDETEVWLKSFFDDIDAQFFIGDASSNWYQCHGWNHTGNRPGSFMILLHRDLGGIGKPCKKWLHNCHE